MDIRTARKIANDIGDVRWADSDRRNAFARLNRSQHRDVARQASDIALARVIWDYFGNRATKGKAIA